MRVRRNLLCMLHFDILSFCVIYSPLDGQNYLTDFAHQVEKDGLFSTCQLKHKFLIKIVFRCIFFWAIRKLGKQL